MDSIYENAEKPPELKGGISLYAPKYRLEAIEAIGRKVLQEYDRTLLEGPPQAVPIETIIETKFNLILEYHTLRKNGSVLGDQAIQDGI